MRSEQPEDRDPSEDLDYEGIQEFRIERGAQVLGTDGSLGTVQLIVVDQATGALQGLVVRGEAGMELELPAAYLESATGDRVYLSIGRADLAAHPELAQAYRPELYQPIDEGAIMPPSQMRNLDAEGPVLTEMETDAVEIATPSSRETQLDELAASAAAPDIAKEPTVVLERGPTEAEPIETAAPEPAMAETRPLADAASESLFPGTLPLTPADQAVAEEARATAQPAQSSAPAANPAPQPSAPRESSREPVGEPRILPVLRPEQAGATVHASRNVASQPLPEPLRGAGPSGGELLVAEWPPEAGRAPRRMAAAGVLAGAGLAAVVYLVWRRRQTSRGAGARADVRARLRSVLSTGDKPVGVVRRGPTFRLPVELRLPVSLPDIRERLRDVGTGAGTLAEALRQGLPSSLPGNVPVSLPDIGPRLRDVAGVGAQLARTPPDVGASADAMRRRGLVRARALVRATDWANIWNTARDGLNDFGSSLRARVPDVRIGAAMSSLRRRASQVTRAAPRPAPGRALRRAGRRARWFRRGLIAGVAWGIFYAPEAGEHTRNRLRSGWQRVQRMSRGAHYQQETRAPQASGAASATGTGTGPRPRNPASEDSVLLGSEISTPLMQPRSEDPLVPPLLPEAGSDEIPGAPSQI